MDAHAALLELQERYGSPSAGDGWTEEQHAEYGRLWNAWRDAATMFHAALPGGSDRYTEEMRVKSAVRHAAAEAEAA
ncbi:hypothetical protein ABZX90_22620 [Streptomyces sp. NPDC002935]|uniref:hypothetical protein n=1 Tax=unclassified Streptomyces TaxID=2593676 RepID=UPI00333290CA